MMPDAFHTKIRTSLGNDGLQSALDANSLRRVALRNAAFASLPDAEDLRQRAHHIRADVIANLDEYLERFIHQVQSNVVLSFISVSLLTIQIGRHLLSTSARGLQTSDSRL